MCVRFLACPTFTSCASTLTSCWRLAAVRRRRAGQAAVVVEWQEVAVGGVSLNLAPALAREPLSRQH